MPKWKSPIFSDIRNAIGDNVVFSQWKGRPYLRAYVKPANPNTNAQMAQREVMKNLVKRYQELASDADVKAAWNAEALEYVISGFNLFVKYGRMSKIAASPGSGSGTVNVTLTYTCGLPVSKAGIVRFNGTTWTIIKNKGTLEAGTDKTVSDTITQAGTYYYFIADLDVLKSGDSSPKAYQAITKWKPNATDGTAVEAKVVVS